MATSRREDFDRLAFAHFRELRRVALRVCEDRETADDLVQETYLRAWRSFDKFEPGTNCRAWLFRIFFYVRSEYRRSHARQPLVFSLDYVKESTLALQTNASSDLPLEEIKQGYRTSPDRESCCRRKSRSPPQSLRESNHDRENQTSARASVRDVRFDRV